MKTLFAAVFVAAVTLGCSCRNQVSEISAVSPDGKNEIRLFANPLAYEVLRNGKVVVAKTEIGLTIDGVELKASDRLPCGGRAVESGNVAAAVYKNAFIDLSANRSCLCFGDWGVQAIARDDGVAYRFTLKKPGAKVINSEKAGITIPAADARCWMNMNRDGAWGCEETIPEAHVSKDIPVDGRMVYLPFVYTVNGVSVAFTESDLHDYPILNLKRVDSPSGVALAGIQPGFPDKSVHVGGWGGEDSDCESGGRWIHVRGFKDYIANAGSSTPWRVFVLGDRMSDFMGADIVNALATPACKDLDFSWVRPGKVAWDWWNAFDNLGDVEGCTTKTYERFIDFAARNGVEYVIFDEGWSESLNIWKFHPNVDVPHLIKYAEAKGVGIVLWMAWAQVYGQEAKVAEHFAKLGAKGFKVDFMDRGDAQLTGFLEKFAFECAKNRMLVDYHGAYRPVGLSRTYPNVVNYEGIHGLEQMKWYDRDPAVMMFNDVAACFLRMTAGPLDYTPGAMLNFPVDNDTYAKLPNKKICPGSVGTRCHQMAMMAMYEAYLQMLADSPTHYEQNTESFGFMAKVPVVWDRTVGLGGDPDTYAAVARKARDGSWYVAVLNTVKAREVSLDTSFLGNGEWKTEFFSDAEDSDKAPIKYVHGNGAVKAGDRLDVKLAPGGGYIARIFR